VILVSLCIISLCYPFLPSLPFHTFPSLLPYFYVTDSNGTHASGLLYRFRVGPNTGKLTFTLSPSSGDPDLFVVVGPGVPTKRDYDYSSVHFGSTQDKITIEPLRLCSNCWVSVLVEGFSTASYSLVASFDSMPIRLLDGLPMKSYSTTSDTTYFSIADQRTNGTAAVVVTLLSPCSVDLYLSSTDRTPGPDTPGRVSTELVLS